MFRLIPCETLDELGKLVGDMLGNGSDEFLGGIYLEVLPVFAFSHPSLVDDFVRCFYKVDLLDVEDVTYDVPSNVKLWSKPLRKRNCFSESTAGPRRKHETYNLVNVIEAGQIMFHGTSLMDDVE